jgi:hypothetical protein
LSIEGHEFLKQQILDHKMPITLAEDADLQKVPVAQRTVGLATIAAAYRILTASPGRFPPCGDDDAAAKLGYLFEDWNRALLLVQYYHRRRSGKDPQKYNFKQIRTPVQLAKLVFYDGATEEQGPAAELVPSILSSASKERPAKRATENISAQQIRYIQALRQKNKELYKQLKVETDLNRLEDLEMQIRENEDTAVQTASSLSKPDLPPLSHADIDFLYDFLLKIRGPVRTADVKPIALSRAKDAIGAAEAVFAAENRTDLVATEADNDTPAGPHLPEPIFEEDDETQQALKKAKKLREDYIHSSNLVSHSSFKYMSVEAAAEQLGVQWDKVALTPLRQDLTYRPHQLVGKLLFIPMRPSHGVVRNQCLNHFRQSLSGLQMHTANIPS